MEWYKKPLKFVQDFTGIVQESTEAVLESTIKVLQNTVCVLEYNGTMERKTTGAVPKNQGNSTGIYCSCTRNYCKHTGIHCMRTKDHGTAQESAVAVPESTITV